MRHYTSPEDYDITTLKLRKQWTQEEIHILLNTIQRLRRHERTARTLDLFHTLSRREALADAS